MSEEELTNNEKEPNKACDPETELLSLLNKVFLAIVLLLSIAGLIKILTINYDAFIIFFMFGGISPFTIFLQVLALSFLGLGISAFIYMYYKGILKKLIGHEIDLILLYTIIIVNILVSLIMFMGYAIYFPMLFDMHKPAIYLYPKEPTEVSITLDPSINLDIDIPRYADKKGWKVMAYPNGKLVDLQPEYTNCSEFETHIFGLEYAKEACELNNYPYIFWEGKQTSKTLPAKKEGWLVKKENIKNFLDEKLNLVGFNEAEKKEFLAYWIPQILSLKQEKFFISFIQTKEINEYLPMKIIPQPDSVNRFYIIVDVHIKTCKPKKQRLIPFKRQGFTLVDWGGCLIQ